MKLKPECERKGLLLKGSRSVNLVLKDKKKGGKVFASKEGV